MNEGIIDPPARANQRPAAALVEFKFNSVRNEQPVRLRKMRSIYGYWFFGKLGREPRKKIRKEKERVTPRDVPGEREPTPKDKKMNRRKRECLPQL